MIIKRSNPDVCCTKEIETWKRDFRIPSLSAVLHTDKRGYELWQKMRSDLPLISYYYVLYLNLGFFFCNYIHTRTGLG